MTGDGGIDMIKCDRFGRVLSYLAQPDADGGLQPDLLVRLRNGIGGTTRIQYAPSSRWGNSFLPAGLVMPTVLAVTTDDGRGNASTVSYQYAGGLWSTVEQRFFGFRKVTMVQDAEGNYTETYYYQKEGTLAKPEYIYQRDNQGTITKYSAFRYTDNDTLPYTSVLTELWTFDCDGGNCRRSLTQLSYDQFANIIATREYGDFDLDGDEKTTVRGYFPNTADYIHGLPAYENIYAGIGTQGQLMGQTLYYYDDNPSYMAMATRGDITRARKWNDQTGGYSSVRNQYDEYGNVIFTWDEIGNRTETIYDSVYHIYPEHGYNAKGHHTSKTWDYTLGLPLTITDEENGSTVTLTYDEMGRPRSESHSESGQTTYDYGNYSDPATFYVRKTVNDGSAEGLWIETYKDGQMTNLTYDPDGNRTQKIGPQGTTKYFSPLVEMVNDQLVKYYYAGSILVAKREGNGSIVRYHSDRLGSVQLMTNSDGQVVNNYEHAAFGRKLKESGSVSNARGFNGHSGDDKLGLIYMNARYYDPVMGRFISPDTIGPDPGNSQAFNRYAYCYNNPISNVDPSGHEPQAATFFALAAIAVATDNPWVLGPCYGRHCCDHGRVCQRKSRADFNRNVNYRGSGRLCRGPGARRYNVGRRGSIGRWCRRSDNITC